MKFSIHINQKQALELGISNINQAMIFDLLTGCAAWAKTQIIEGDVYYWVARQTISKELQILNLKPDTVYRHLKKLHQIGVIQHVKYGVKDCIKITEKGRKYYVGNESELSPPTMSEINPNHYVGNESENNSEINPTYQTTKNIISLSNISDSDILFSFESFYENYPKKVGKESAKKAWKKITLKEKKLAIENLNIRYANTEITFIPNPATYLNGKRWEDEIIQSDQSTPHSKRFQSAIKEFSQ